MCVSIDWNLRIIILCTTFEADVKVNNTASNIYHIYEYACYTISCVCDVVSKT